LNGVARRLNGFRKEQTRKTDRGAIGFLVYRLAVRAAPFARP
jgi:hypothetical protein